MEITYNSLQAHEILYFSTTFQSRLEEADYFSNLPSEEERPFDNKYIARKFLEELLVKNEMARLSQDSLSIAQGIVQYLLGVNYFDTEENYQAERSFTYSLQRFTTLSREKIIPYLQYIQELYNSLGIIFSNRDDVSSGLGLFAKAEELHTLLKRFYEKSPVDVVHTMSAITDTKKQKFRYFYQGGLNLVKIEKNHTLTLFYMAQAYTKANLRYKSAEYCAATLKRQYETKDYDLKEWVVNCLSLSDFYNGNFEFAQAQYLLLCAFKVVPETKEKLMATVNMALGHHLLEYLQYGVEKYLTGLSKEESVKASLNRQSFKIESIDVDFPTLKPPTTTDELTSIFRQLNTQFKKAMKHYVFDGFVTEYVQIIRDLSKAYRYLSLAEKDHDRIMGMLERRKDLIEGPANELNPKVFENYWQHLTLEIAEIYNEMFERKYTILAQGEVKGKKSTFELLNKCCLEANKYFEALINNMTTSTDKELLDNIENLKTIITAKFNVARNFSRFQSFEPKEKVEFLARSLEAYRWILTFIDQQIKPRGLATPETEQTYISCKEMVSLLPGKIDRVNAGLLN